MLKVLILEEKIPAGQAISQFLENSNRKIQCEVVNAADQFFCAVDQLDIDVILVENGACGCCGASIFEQLQEKNIKIPFILCSKPLGDDQVVALLKKGIADYVTYENLGLLPEKIQEAKLKNDQPEHKKVNDIFENIAEGILEIDYAHNIHYANKNAGKVLKCEVNGLPGENLFEMFPGALNTSLYKALVKARQSQKTSGYSLYYEPLEIWMEGNIVPHEHGMSIFIRDITQEKQFENTVENLSVVARNTLNGVIITDKYRKITWVNKAFTKITGYKLKEIKHKIPYQFLVGAETQKKSLQKINEKLEAGQSVSTELIYYKKDGSPFWTRLEITPVLHNGEVNKFIGLYTDITRKKHSEQQLKLLEKVVENSNDIVAITSANTQEQSGWPEIVYANKAFKNITGFIPGEIKGKSLSCLIGRDTRKEDIRQITKAFNRGKKLEKDLILYKKNGDFFWAHISLVPLKNTQKEITHYIFILKDITHQKLDDIEKRQLITNLQNYNHTLEQYAFITSHNLRAPIAQIIGLTNLIQSDLNQNDLSKYIQYLQDSALNLDQIIRDMNQLLDIRNNKSLPKEKMNVRLLLEEIINKMSEDQKCQIRDININLGENLYLFSNKGYLEHILLKLLDNCVKFRKKNIPLSIHIDGQELDEQYLVSISDNGLGFDAIQHKERIFRPYQHFNTDLESKGLGLSIVKAHVDALGGQIEVDSKEGKGTTFRILLPKNDTPDLLKYSKVMEAQ